MAWDRKQFLFYANVFRNTHGPLRVFECTGIEGYIKLFSEKFDLLIAVADKLDSNAEKLQMKLEKIRLHFAEKGEDIEKLLEEEEREDE